VPASPNNVNILQTVIDATPDAIFVKDLQDGKIPGLLSMSRDISARKRTEAAIRPEPLRPRQTLIRWSVRRIR
jgi:hypothetical protein